MDYKLRTNRVRARSFPWLKVLERGSEFSGWEVAGEIYWRWYQGPPMVRHFLRNESRRLTINTSYFLFLTSWAAMALTETGQLWGLCRDLPVRLLIVLHAFLLECGKSMFWIASDHRSLRFLSSQVIRAVAALLDWSSAGDCRNFGRGPHT